MRRRGAIGVCVLNNAATRFRRTNTAGDAMASRRLKAAGLRRQYVRPVFRGISGHGHLAPSGCWGTRDVQRRAGRPGTPDREHSPCFMIRAVLARRGAAASINTSIAVGQVGRGRAAGRPH